MGLYSIDGVEPALRNSPVAVAFNGSNPSTQIEKHPIHLDGVLFLAEQEGFEPSVPFWGTHDFQSCPL